MISRFRLIFFNVICHLINSNHSLLFFFSLPLRITRFIVLMDLICASSVLKSSPAQRIRHTFHYTRVALCKILWRINWTRLLIYRSECFFHTSLILFHSILLSVTPFLATSRVVCLAFEWARDMWVTEQSQWACRRGDCLCDFTPAAVDLNYCLINLLQQRTCWVIEPVKILPTFTELQSIVTCLEQKPPW
jgi:hypothetical protein